MEFVGGRETPVVKVMDPWVPSVASPALVRRFMTTCLNWMESARTCGSSGRDGTPGDGRGGGDPKHVHDLADDVIDRDGTHTESTLAGIGQKLFGEVGGFAGRLFQLLDGGLSGRPGGNLFARQIGVAEDGGQ
jgi:hypothetical protein